MVRLKEGKLKWTFKQKEKGARNKYLAHLVGIGIIRFQQIDSDYKKVIKICILLN